MRPTNENSSVDGAKSTDKKNQGKSTNENSSVDEAKSTPPADKPSNTGATDNTINFIGIVFSILNSIVLGILFWLNKKSTDEIHKELRNSQRTIDLLKSKSQPLEALIKKVDGEQQNYSHKTDKEIEVIKRSIEELSRRSASIQQSASIPQSNYRGERSISPSERLTHAPVNRQLTHTDRYNEHQSDFQNRYQITAVSRETENANQSRAAQTDSVILAGDKQGNYWLFSDGSEIYLVPKQNLKITNNRISNTRDLFECQDYNEQNYDNFTLIKPAVLVAQGNGNWQLKEKGKLQFG